MTLDAFSKPECGEKEGMRCTCHQGRKCANCMMAEGLLDVTEEPQPT